MPRSWEPSVPFEPLPKNTQNPQNSTIARAFLSSKLKAFWRSPLMRCARYCASRDRGTQRAQEYTLNYRDLNIMI